MNWAAVGAIGEIVGAIAVIATLVYLALQTRHMKEATDANTRAIRSSAAIESGRYWSGEIVQLAVSPDMATIVATGFEDASQLDDPQRERYIAWLAQHMVAVDALYHQFRDGALPEQLWIPHENVVVGLLNYDSFVRVWNAGYIPVSPDLKEFVDRLILERQSPEWKYDNKARIFD